MLSTDAEVSYTGLAKVRNNDGRYTYKTSKVLGLAAHYSYEEVNAISTEYSSTDTV